ncbi:hypothetical protein UlMin_002808 [Ulmus minor]
MDCHILCLLCLLRPQNLNHKFVRFFKDLIFVSFLNFNPTRSSTGASHPCPLATSHVVTLRGNFEATGVPTSMHVCVAHELLHAGHQYLRHTCSRFHNRTPEEFITGHAPEAINIPYMYKVGSGMTKNSQILAEVSKYFRKDGCLSGKRSMIAATDLLMKFVLMFGFDFLWGYSCITDIADGYVAWTQNALPTEL